MLQHSYPNVYSMLPGQLAHAHGASRSIMVLCAWQLAKIVLYMCVMYTSLFSEVARREFLNIFESFRLYLGVLRQLSCLSSVQRSDVMLKCVQSKYGCEGLCSYRSL